MIWLRFDFLNAHGTASRLAWFFIRSISFAAASGGLK